MAAKSYHILTEVYREECMSHTDEFVVQEKVDKIKKMINILETHVNQLPVIILKKIQQMFTSSNASHQTEKASRSIESVYACPLVNTYHMVQICSPGGIKPVLGL